MGTQFELTVTTLVIGLPRQVVVQRCRRADVEFQPFGGIPDLMNDPATSDGSAAACLSTSRPRACGRSALISKGRSRRW
jgi:hypothetical protein